MAIIFRCMCGKKMQARDELAGRLMQCPICCYLFKIPGEGPGSFVRFTCGCGLKLKAYSFNAGEDVDCPGCGREQTIPSEVSSGVGQLAPVELDQDQEADVVVAGPVATTAPEFGSWPGFVPSPKSSPYLSASAMVNDTLFVQHSVGWIDQKARGLNGKGPPEPRVRSRLLPILVFAGVVLLFGGWVLGSQHAEPYRGNATKIDDLALVPTDTVGLVSIHFASLWDRPQLRKDSKAISLAQGFATGLNWQDDDIERVTLIWLPPKPGTEAEKATAKKAAKKAGKKAGDPAPKFAAKDNYCLVVKARIPLIKDRVGPQLEAGGYNTSFAKRAYYRNTKGDLAVFVASDRTVVVSTVKGIEHFLRSQLWVGEEHPMAEALAMADKHDVVVAYNFAIHSPMADNVGAAAILEPGLLTALLTVDEVRQQAPRSLDADLRMTFVNKAEAEAAKQRKDAEIKGPDGSYQCEVEDKTMVLHYRSVGTQADQFWYNLAAVVEKNVKLVPR